MIGGKPMRSIALLVSVLLASGPVLAVATGTHAADFESVCGPEPPLPIARGQDELRAAMIEITRYVKAESVSASRFSVLTRPYAPLDFEIRGSHTPEEASAVKNFLFGAAGAAVSLDGQTILAYSVHFFRRYADRQGKDAWAVHLEGHRALVERFRALKDVAVIARWAAGEYRIGDEFGLSTKSWAGRCSDLLGLCPWAGASPNGKGNALSVAQQDAARSILQEMEILGIPAMVRQSSGAVRVVQDGVADNEVGTLFLASGIADPRVGDELTDGKEIAWLDRLAPGVFYYLAN